MAPVASRKVSREARKVGAASMIGTAIEWYDYYIFGTAAALIFGKLYFPEFSPVAGLLASFATFAVGFIARPLGALIFGYFGDRVGRKPMMVWSLVLMGVATVSIGLLPTFDMIGIWAPALLVCLRIVQGIGVGGEWGAAALMSVEHSPAERRGFLGSLPAAGAPLGVLLSSSVFIIVSSWVPAESFEVWGWRIPFLLSAILLVVGYVIRRTIEESPVFSNDVRVVSAQPPLGNPLFEAVKRYPRTIALAAGTYVSTAAMFYVQNTWMISHATAQIGLSRSTVLTVSAVAAAISIVWLLAAGGLSDRLGRRNTLRWGASGMAVFAFPYFWLSHSGSVVLYAIAAIVGIAFATMIAGPVAALYAELFPTQVRYSGASMSFQCASVVGGGFTPMIATALYAWAGASWPIAVYLILLNILALLCLWVLPETRGVDLRERLPECEKARDEIRTTARNQQTGVQE